MHPIAPIQDPRKVAPIIWGALLAGQVAFLLVALFAQPGMRPADPGFARTLLLLLASFAAVLVLLSRLLPPRLPRQAGVSPDQHALSRNIVACAFCEGAGLFSIVIFLVTGSPAALAILVLPLAGLVSCWPSDARWEALGGTPRDGAQRGAPGRGGGAPR
jgi:hypothetical protein